MSTLANIENSNLADPTESQAEFLARLLDVVRSEAHAAGRLEERERAAKICDEQAALHRKNRDCFRAHGHEWHRENNGVFAAKSAAAAIRREPDADGE